MKKVPIPVLEHTDTAVAINKKDSQNLRSNNDKRKSTFASLTNNSQFSHTQYEDICQQIYNYASPDESDELIIASSCQSDMVESNIQPLLQLILLTWPMKELIASVADHCRHKGFYAERIESFQWCADARKADHPQPDDTYSNMPQMPRIFLRLMLRAPSDIVDTTDLVETLRHKLKERRHRESKAVEVINRLTALLPELEQEPHQSRDHREEMEFLHWLLAGNFNFIHYQTTPVEAADAAASLLRVTRHCEIQPDNTSAPVEAIVIRQVCGHTSQHRIHVFTGQFERTLQDRSVFDIPLLRIRAKRAQAALASHLAAYDQHTLDHLIETFPRLELLCSDSAQLHHMLLENLQSLDCSQVKVLLRNDTLGNFISVITFIPKTRFNSHTRTTLEQYLHRQMQYIHCETSVRHMEGNLARVSCTVYMHSSLGEQLDPATLEADIDALTQSWPERLEALIALRVPQTRHFTRLAQCLPSNYRANFSPEEAIQHFERLQGLTASQPLSLQLKLTDASASLYRLRMAGKGKLVTLSVIVPMLESLGVQVISAHPYPLQPHDAEPCWLLDLDITQTTADGDNGASLDTSIFCDALCQLYTGAIEQDAWNRLVSNAGMNWRDVTILRALSQYIAQLQPPFSASYMAATLIRHPQVACLLRDLFYARFSPSGQTAEQSDSLLQQLNEKLNAVNALDEERIMRCFVTILTAMVRTSFFQRDTHGQAKPYLSFKVASAQIPNIAEPRPLYEIFVYSPRIEGIHLRGARVARGGIRWSDRREDFRTEILGLLKAQLVKNAVIVPRGAKGGFICKQLPQTDDAKILQHEAIQCYRQFINALLDMTDNQLDGAVIKPLDTVCHDSDDPYLVVAADKGTATFSDIANEIAVARGFWLQDAFASGGSNGYDHKKMGITARGAWESVKRLLWQRGIDPQTTAFTVAGIGDMSGDVFGNGMLLSHRIKLVAAFNHQHIFLDPDPHAERSFSERRRLFTTPGSRWSDYRTQALSEGGGIYARSLKRIPISRQVREVLTLADGTEFLSPNALIQAILRAPVDLLWNGGIGTYIKASTENHQDAGDRHNDPVRIDAADLRCQVVAEGGNLGLTQRARVEFARGNGLISTDAIDNSAGVDCSDHEVNIKILLALLTERGQLDSRNRNALLETMGDQVSALVLRQNYQQSKVLSLEHALHGRDIATYKAILRQLEADCALTRSIEALPSDEVLEQLETTGQGISRPELAVILGYCKLQMRAALNLCELIHDDYCVTEIVDYFPSQLHADYRELILQHPLRNEIVSTHLTNQVINRVGPSFTARLRLRTGATTPQVIKAYIVSREILGTRALWREIEQQDTDIPHDQQLALLEQINTPLEHTALAVLQLDDFNTGSVGELIAHYRTGLAQLAQQLPDLIEAPNANVPPQDGMPEPNVLPSEFMQQLQILPILQRSLVCIDVARAGQIDIIRIFRLDARIAATTGLFEARKALLQITTSNTHSTEMVQSWLKALDQVRTRILQHLSLAAPAPGEYTNVVDQWCTAHAVELDAIRTIVASLIESSTNIASFWVLIQRLGSLADQTASAPNSPLLPTDAARTLVLPAGVNA